MSAVSSIRLDMLELLGKGYVVDYCMAFFRRKKEQEKYLSYYADALSIISETLAGYVGGKYVKRMGEGQKEETRTASEIIDRIKAKLEE